MLNTSYQVIAEILAEAMAECRSFEDKETIVFLHEYVIEPLSVQFEAGDPQFDSESFQLLCGYRGERSI